MQGRPGTYYIGEWHFHPFMSPVPSGTDLRQIRAIARDRDYQCPVPILIVVGGDPSADPLMVVSVVDGSDIVGLDLSRRADG